MLYVPINSYGHVGTVISPLEPHFFPGQACSQILNSLKSTQFVLIGAFFMFSFVALCPKSTAMVMAINQYVHIFLLVTLSQRNAGERP